MYAAAEVYITHTNGAPCGDTAVTKQEKEKLKREELEKWASLGIYVANLACHLGMFYLKFTTRTHPICSHSSINTDLLSVWKTSFELSTLAMG